MCWLNVCPAGGEGRGREEGRGRRKRSNRGERGETAEKWGSEQYYHSSYLVCVQ